jgi:hypothetical protein
METEYVLREHELLVHEVEARAQLFRDEPRRPRWRLFGRRAKPLAREITLQHAELNPWDATYLRAA